jgi:hypothetical protein
MAVSSSRKPVSFSVICQFKIGPSEKAPPADGTTIVIGRVGIILSCEWRLPARRFIRCSAASYPLSEE